LLISLVKKQLDLFLFDSKESKMMIIFCSLFL